MRVLETADAMRAWSREHRAAGQTLGFVPTMGALHEGHASLIRASVAVNAATVVSVFVNPTQFAPNEDLDRYPRTWDADRALCQELGVDAVYLPKAADMYREGHSTSIQVEGPAIGLESVARPHFFRGVATVVAKLFNAVEPDVAYFGQKDAQQAAVVRRMAADLDFGVEVAVCPLVRDPDGLALSSRNRYLDPGERRAALGMSRGLAEAFARLQAGERDAAQLAGTVRKHMQDVAIEYVEVVDRDSMVPQEHVAGPVCIVAACHAGETRLIDNVVFDPGS
jgi:pantoate--beta-alanine ligase